MKQKPMKRTAMLLGALIAGAICISGASAVTAVDDSRDDRVTTSLGQVDLKEKGYSATLVVVSESGAESIPVSRSDLTVFSVLNSRGYSPESFKDDKGNPIQIGQRLQNGEQVVIYSVTVEGKSESIDLNLPDAKTEDGSLYEGQIVVNDPGKIGKALKTTIIHRDLSKVSQTTTVAPEKLDTAALSSEATQTGEEIYITVLEAPEPKRLTVGTKPCGSQYLCDLLKNGGLASLEISGPYVHPLGNAVNWTTYYGSTSHEGGAVDFPMGSGTPIYAVADGVVIESNLVGGAGNMAAIRHIDGTITGYFHMVELPVVKIGDSVKAGEIIGFVGSTGKSTGPHLHFQVWKDKLWGAIIPSYEYMRLHGVELGSCIEGPCELSKRG